MSALVPNVGFLSARYRIFCPRCGDSYATVGAQEERELRRAINRACRVCDRHGVDAVVVR